MLAAWQLQQLARASSQQLAAGAAAMEKWGEAEVQEWLRVNDLYDSYGEAFAESQVDGETLVTLTLEEMLVDVLEVVD